MAQKKKTSKSASAKGKSSASPGKKRLGVASLNWITKKPKGEKASSQQAEKSENESYGKLKETKIGLLKQYGGAQAKKMKDKTPEVPPVISGPSSTITKGERVTPMKEEEAQKTEVIEEELVLAEEEDKTISDKKESVPDDKKIPMEYEVKKEDVTTEEEISEEHTVYIPEDSSSIAKERRETELQEEIIISEDKTHSEKKKTYPPTVKKEMPSSAKRKWMKISGIYESLKKESPKVLGSIVKTFKSDKTKLRKSVSSVNFSKQPVKAISAVDHKITQSMRGFLSDLGNVEKSILKNIKLTDTKITKSAEKVINSILD